MSILKLGSKKDIIIWGYGVIAKKIYTANRTQNVFNILYFVDNFSVSRLYDNNLVIHSSEFMDYYNGEPVMVCVKNYYQIGDVVRQLHHYGVKQVLIANPCLFEKEDVDIIHSIDNKEIYKLDISYKSVISKLEFHVVDNCNLNCRGCSHFAPLFDDRKVLLSDFEDQMKQVSRVFANVLRFRLMGGEPFLHEQLGDFVQLARKYLPYANLEIVTNGLLYKKVSEDTWDKIKKYDAKLNISLYKPTNKIKYELEKKLLEKKITHSFGSGLEQYNDTGVIDDFHKCFTNNGNHNPIISSRGCVGVYCHYLRNGYISKCAIPQLVYKVNEVYSTDYNIEEGDVFKLSKVIDPWDLATKLRKHAPFCKYCCEGNTERFAWCNTGEYKLSDYRKEE